MNHAVRVIPPDAGWPRLFDAAARTISPALGPNLIALHHIGSTSIPGIYAKPVIDMLAIVKDLDQLDRDAGKMVALGYEAMGEFGIPGRRYFRRDDAGGVRTHQVHAFVDHTTDVVRHLAFRNYLRAHPADALAYSELKQRLAAAHPNDMNAYMDGKNAFIKQIELAAIVWLAKERLLGRRLQTRTR